MKPRHRIVGALTLCAMLAGSVHAQEKAREGSESDRITTVKLVHGLLSDKRYSYYAHPLDDAMSSRIFDDYVAALQPGGAAVPPSLERYRTVLDDEIGRGRLDVAYAIADAMPPAQRGKPRSRDDVLQLFLNAYAIHADPGARYASPFASSPPSSAPIRTTTPGRDWTGARQSVLDVGGKRVGVIALGSLGTTRGEGSTSHQVARMLEELAASGVSALVLDVRGSPGGLLTEALDLAGLFVGTVPALQIEESGERVSTESSRVAQVWQGAVAVLVDGATVSGAETVAAILQDHGRGPVVGTTTAGVAAVRNQVALDRWPGNGERRYGDVTLTIAQMFRLDGRPIDVAGVVPDVVLDSGVEPRVPAEGPAPDAIGRAKNYRAPKPLGIARSALPARPAGVDAALFETAALLVGATQAQASRD